MAEPTRKCIQIEPASELESVGIPVVPLGFNPKFWGRRRWDLFWFLAQTSHNYKALHKFVLNVLQCETHTMCCEPCLRHYTMWFTIHPPQDKTHTQMLTWVSNLYKLVCAKTIDSLSLDVRLKSSAERVPCATLFGIHSLEPAKILYILMMNASRIGVFSKISSLSRAQKERASEMEETKDAPSAWMSLKVSRCESLVLRERALFVEMLNFGHIMAKLPANPLHNKAGKALLEKCEHIANRTSGTYDVLFDSLYDVFQTELQGGSFGIIKKDKLLESIMSYC